MIIFYITLMILLMLVIPTILFITLQNKPRVLKIYAIVLSVVYFILLFIGTTFSVKLINKNLVINPDFSHGWFSMSFLGFDFSITNTLINLALLFPIGFIIFTFAKKHKLLKTILFTFIISVFIELYQFILPVPRTTELTDILFNTLSGLISGLYCLFLEKITRKKDIHSWISFFKAPNLYQVFDYYNPKVFRLGQQLSFCSCPKAPDFSKLF